MHLKYDAALSVCLFLSFTVNVSMNKTSQGLQQLLISFVSHSLQTVIIKERIMWRAKKSQERRFSANCVTHFQFKSWTGASSPLARAASFKVELERSILRTTSVCPQQQQHRSIFDSMQLVSTARTKRITSIHAINECMNDKQNDRHSILTASLVTAPVNKQSKQNQQQQQQQQ